MKFVSRKDQLSSIIARLDGHLEELKRELARMRDGLELMRVELESYERPPEERVRMALGCFFKMVTTEPATEG